jgi:hypothetical protein
MMKRIVVVALVGVFIGAGPKTEVLADGPPAPQASINSPAIRGVAVKLDGQPIGRFLGYVDGLVVVGLPDTAPASGTVLVSQAASLWNAPLMEVISPTGYTFHIATGDLDSLSMGEGDLERAIVLFYDLPNCGGQAYLPVQSETGRFGSWTLGDGRLRPLKRWAVRQGIVIGSSDPADATPIYMLRRGAPVEQVFLQSFKVFSVNVTPPGAVCVSPPLPPVLDSAVRAEPLDPVEAGVSGPLGGEISLGW